MPALLPLIASTKKRAAPSCTVQIKRQVVEPPSRICRMLRLGLRGGSLSRSIAATAFGYWHPFEATRRASLHGADRRGGANLDGRVVAVHAHSRDAAVSQKGDVNPRAGVLVRSQPAGLVLALDRSHRTDPGELRLAAATLNLNCPQRSASKSAGSSPNRSALRLSVAKVFEPRRLMESSTGSSESSASLRRGDAMDIRCSRERIDGDFEGELLRASASLRVASRTDSESAGSSPSSVLHDVESRRPPARCYLGQLGSGSRCVGPPGAALVPRPALARGRSDAVRGGLASHQNP